MHKVLSVFWSLLPLLIAVVAAFICGYQRACLVHSRRVLKFLNSIDAHDFAQRGELERFSGMMDAVHAIRDEEKKTG